jgi:conserved hypothetical integral membrane protein
MLNAWLGFLGEYYLIIKALHLIAMVAWMAGLFYLPRLFVYHAEAPKGSPLSETFKVMERRLLRIIMNPAMIVTFITGALLLSILGSAALRYGWFHGKITLVLCLAGFHGLLAKWRKDFMQDNNQKSHRFFRVMNEVPTILMVGIIFLVVLKPF